MNKTKIFLISVLKIMKINILDTKSVLIFIFLLAINSCNFAPGSYPYAEEYLINSNESTLIKAIQDFKKNNPQYNVPVQIQLHDGRNDKKDYWYNIYFYYPEEDQIMYTWTRPSDMGKTTFAFISVNQGLMLGHWKVINEDFDDTENKMQKKKFEERILNKVKEIL